MLKIQSYPRENTAGIVDWDYVERNPGIYMYSACENNYTRYVSLGNRCVLCFPSGLDKCVAYSGCGEPYCKEYKYRRTNQQISIVVDNQE